MMGFALAADCGVAVGIGLQDGVSIVPLPVGVRLGNGYRADWGCGWGEFGKHPKVYILLTLYTT